MTPLKLTSWFRRRMLPLVATSSLVVMAAAPIAYYVQARRELVESARAHSRRVAAVLQAEIAERPLLWRYDAPKLAARLGAEGLDRVPELVVRDAAGVAVPVKARGEAMVASWSPPWLAPRLWGRAEVVLGGETVARVWTAVGTAPLARDTAWLALGFALLGGLLGVVLYHLPTRAIARAERRIHVLMAQLTLTLQEAERRRIARDLHDGAGQAITAARLGLLALKRQLEPEALALITRHLDEALEEVRRSTAALAPPALAELGLRGALERHCETFADTTGIAVECRVAESLPALPAHVETACFRMVQEGLTNTGRHAGARRAWVRLEAQAEGARLHLEIGDDGRGLGAEADRRGDGSGGGSEGVRGRSQGRGLAGIRERVELLGGTLAIEGQAGTGVRIDIVLPLDATEAGNGSDDGPE